MAAASYVHTTVHGAIPTGWNTVDGPGVGCTRVPCPDETRSVRLPPPTHKPVLYYTYLLHARIVYTMLDGVTFTVFCAQKCASEHLQ